MPKQGILRLFVDEPTWNTWYYFFYNVSDANTRLSEVHSCSKKDIEYNNATGSYQMTAETALDAGEYYVIIDSGIISDPIKLTMSYIEPTISVSAITLNATQGNLDKGKQYPLTASISPTNATCLRFEQVTKSSSSKYCVSRLFRLSSDNKYDV